MYVNCIYHMLFITDMFQQVTVKTTVIYKITGSPNRLLKCTHSYKACLKLLTWSLNIRWLAIKTRQTSISINKLGVLIYEFNVKPVIPKLKLT